MELKRKVRFLISLLFVMIFASVSNALPTGALSGWSGNASFGYIGLDGRVLTGRIDYAVYDVSSYPGTPPADGDYIYAYQVFNHPSSDIYAELFTVGILEGTSVEDIYVDQIAGGVDPLVEYFSPSANPAVVQNANFLFLPPPTGHLIRNGRHSDYLLFSSDHVPTQGFGLIEGGAIGGTITGLPTPSRIPEPATVVLLGAGGLVSFSRRKKRFVFPS